MHVHTYKSCLLKWRPCQVADRRRRDHWRFVTGPRKKNTSKNDIEHVLPWRSLFNKMRVPCQDIHKVSRHPVSWGRHFKSHLLKECAWPITHFAQAHYLYVGRSTPSWHIRARIKFISGKGNALSGCLCICLWRGMHGHIQRQNQTICWISRVRDA